MLLPYLLLNKKPMLRKLILTVCITSPLIGWGQDKPLDMKMDFEEYDPPSSLVVEEHRLSKAKFPFIDIHNHQCNMDSGDLSKLIADMDKLNMAVMNNLSGRGFSSNGPNDFSGNDEHLKKSLDNINKNFPNRFTLFTTISFGNIDDPSWAANTAKQLEANVKLGAKGL